MLIKFEVLRERFKLLKPIYEVSKENDYAAFFDQC